jgi:hypothetical protein
MTNTLSEAELRCMSVARKIGYVLAGSGHGRVYRHEQPGSVEFTHIRSHEEETVRGLLDTAQLALGTRVRITAPNSKEHLAGWEIVAPTRASNTGSST